MRLKGLYSLFFFVLSGICFGQTNPTAQALPFSFTSQSGSTLAAGMAVHRFGTTAGSIPTTRTTAAGTGDLPYTATSTSGGWKDEAASGLSILASGSQGAGALIVAINTTALSTINVSWKAGTILQQASYDMSVALQYRIGTSGIFTDVGTTTTYTSQGKTAGDISATLSETLPAAADNQAVVQVRWIYWASNGASGSRDRLNIDDINITSCTTPATQASNITFPSVYGTSLVVNWTNGTGSNHLVKINTSNSFVDPTNGVAYSANTVFGGSEQVVYNGTSNSVTVTGLTPNTTYWFRVYDFSCPGASSLYNVTVATNNPLSQTTCNGCSTPSDYFRSLVTGNWNTASNWESSPDNVTWNTATLVPTSSAAAITILNTHTITIDANSSAPTLTINNGGTLQANAASFVTLTLIGDLVNNGIVQMVNGVKGVDVVFNKNGSQSITGTGATTNFYSIGLNMGTSRGNYLTVSPSNFSCSPSRALLFNSSGTNALLNGTIKFSGSYTFSGPIFTTGASYAIAATAGVWLNNSNVTITSSLDSYDVSGLLRITAGTFNVGTAVGNSIRLLSGCSMQVQGGNVNVASRIQAANSGGTFQGTVTYNQSGGTVILSTAGSNTSGSIADLDFHLFSDSLIMSGGTIIIRNEAVSFSDVLNYATCAITGGTIQFGDASTVSAAFGFEIEVGGGSYLPSLLLDNSSGLNPLVYPGTDVRVIGSITINNGTTLDNNWGSGFLYNFSLTGNWNNSGTFVHNNSNTITFNGTSAQSINGTTTTAFNNLTINNSLGGVTLNTPATIAGTAGVLTLTNGHLITTATNLLTMNAGTSTTGANNNSFVDGPMSKIGSTNFTFPVGKDVQYRSIGINTLTGSETFTAEYFHADPDAVPYDVTLKDPTLDDIGRCEYWILNRAGSVNANVILSWNTYSCGVTSLPDLAVARWDGTMWKDEGNTLTTGAPDPGTGTVTSGVVTSFSPFTLASKTTIVNPLPIELLSFNAAYTSNNVVDINWSTASEIHNDYFTIERSADAVSFDAINVTDGAGNSTSVLNYSTTDNEPLNGTSYYRLKQTDFDGQYKYSSTVAVQKNENDFEIVSAHYTLANEFAVYFNCNSNCLVTVDLYDINGKKVYSSFENTLGKNSEILIPTKNLSEGIYLVKAYNGSKLISKKVKL